MLQSLRIRNFTVFKGADLTFAPGLNVIVGANGTGKTHLPKLPYAVMAMGAEESRKCSPSPTKTLLQDCINVHPLEVEPLKDREIFDLLG